MKSHPIHKVFVDKFNATLDVSPLTVDEIYKIENEIRFQFPSIFRVFLASYTNIYTPQLLDLIIDRNLKYPDMQNIACVKDLIDGNICLWDGGMPKKYISFANDSMGNAFCFERCNNPDNSAVYFFDHDFDSIEKINADFNGLLNWYVTNLV